MKKIFPLFSLFPLFSMLSINAFSDNTQVTPIPNGSLTNDYIFDEYGLSEVIDTEVVAGRYSFERALLDRNIIFMGELVPAPPVRIFTNEELADGSFTLPEAEKTSLLEMAAIGSVGIRVESNEPIRAMDCQKAAVELDASTSEMVNRVSCVSNNEGSILTTSHQYRPLSITYNYSTELFGFRFIDRKRYTDWTINVLGPAYTQVANGVYREYRREAWNTRGMVPIVMNGITLFVEADVRVSEPWELYKRRNVGSEEVAFNSGRRFYIQCGTHKFYEDEDYFPVGFSGLTMDLSSTFDSYCADKDVTYHFENMQNTGANTTSVTFIPQSYLVLPTDYIGIYAQKLEVKLNDAADNFFFYSELYNPTEDASPGDGDATAYKTSAQEFSSSLENLMKQYADFSSELSTSDVDQWFFSDASEVQSWAESDQSTFDITSDDFDFMVGVYKGPFVEEDPVWLDDFNIWFHDESGLAGAEVSPAFSIEAINDVARYALDPIGLDVHYAFGCKYLEAWEHLTKAKVMADRYMFLMDQYSFGNNLPPAYLDMSDLNQANIMYQTHKQVVSAENANLMSRLQSEGFAYIPSWNETSRNTMCPTSSGGGFSD
ncbi:hypothetical protein BGP77_03890 [Saccharospirillum sp. MSK14-1]|uniref:hypothetical protein n=1 Tax=Saccharospirillum sp. MSK14-1 TaxID=1897632 RepID=UPI000D3B9EFB|nr:hypothetical protein [Saccharospirillum sp. MSK14-1]PTY36450.1 hypothetical protein BGP77_03890 [Saccharospirillum sp. MSK14-1]